jgi:hypothetical protein
MNYVKYFEKCGFPDGFMTDPTPWFADPQNHGHPSRQGLYLGRLA